MSCFDKKRAVTLHEMSLGIKRNSRFHEITFSRTLCLHTGMISAVMEDAGRSKFDYCRCQTTSKTESKELDTISSHHFVQKRSVVLRV